MCQIDQDGLFAVCPLQGMKDPVIQVQRAGQRPSDLLLYGVDTTTMTDARDMWREHVARTHIVMAVQHQIYDIIRPQKPHGWDMNLTTSSVRANARESAMDLAGCSARVKAADRWRRNANVLATLPESGADADGTSTPTSSPTGRYFQTGAIFPASSFSAMCFWALVLRRSRALSSQTGT
jgi:hypothetical protein